MLLFFLGSLDRTILYDEKDIPTDRRADRIFMEKMDGRVLVV